MLKNVTLSADEALIEAARERARAEDTSLNVAFRKWLESYAAGGAKAVMARAAISDLRARVSTGGRRFTREQMNER